MLEYFELDDPGVTYRLIKKYSPDEIYNLAAQSHVRVSFDIPASTTNTIVTGVLNILEAIRNTDTSIKFYQASSSEMFGRMVENPAKESTPFYPRSPYGVAKVYAHWITINYREAYNIFACNGILFNHESPVRGETFVTRKITSQVVKIKLDIENNIVPKPLSLGNIYSKRDWSDSEDFVCAFWKILNQKEPKDYILSSGIQHTVFEFVNLAFSNLLNIFLYSTI